MAVHNSGAASSSLLHHNVFPLSSKGEKVVIVTKKPENLALAITLAVLAVLLIVGGLTTLFLLPHFGIMISPIFALLAIPVLVGLVKIALAIFVLHKPAKQEISQEIKVLEKEIEEVMNSKYKNSSQLATNFQANLQSSSEKS